MHIWWAVWQQDVSRVPLQVWDRDMWIRTDTSEGVYEDRFRPGEQLYGTCVHAAPSWLQERRDAQEHSHRRSMDAAAENLQRAQQKRLRRFWARQDEYLAAEGGEAVEGEGPGGVGADSEATQASATATAAGGHSDARWAG